jgi:hypothetical protein
MNLAVFRLLGRIAALALVGLAFPAAALAAAPYYADGVIHCPDGHLRPWANHLGPPLAMTMDVACNDFDSSLTPAVGPQATNPLPGVTVIPHEVSGSAQLASNASEADKQAQLDKDMKDTIALASPLPISTMIEAQRQQKLDRQALDGDLGRIARLKAAWRLGRTDILAEQAGRASFYLILILVVLWLFGRRKSA